MAHIGMVLAAVLVAALPQAASRSAPVPGAVPADACFSRSADDRPDPAGDKARIAACTAGLASASDPEARAAMLLARSESYYRSKAMVRALEDLEAVLTLHPDSPDLAYLHGLLLSTLKFHAAAEAEADRAIRLGLKAPAAYALRGIAKSYMGQHGEAMADLDLALAEAPENEPALSARGFAGLETGAINQAIADFDHALAINPHEIAALYYRGKAHYALDQYDAALADFAAAERLAPIETGASYYIAEIKAIQMAPVAQPSSGAADGPSVPAGRTHNCSAYYPFIQSKLLEVGDVLIHYDVSDTGGIAGVGLDRSSSNDSLDRAALFCVSHHWKNTPAHQNGVAIPTPGHRALIRFVQRAAAPDDLDRADTLAGLGRYDEAIAEYGRVIVAVPGDAQAHFRRGLTYYLMQNYAAAEDDFAKALSLKPDMDDAAAGRELVRRAVLVPTAPGKSI